jgi:hypothetical protein
MTTSSADRAVEDYLLQLRRELRDVPRERRKELVGEIREHIEEAREGLAPGDEAGVLNVLDRLGDPADIAAEARGRDGAAAPGRVLEIMALVLMLPGSLLLFVFGWLAGVVMLWLSNVWTLRDKLIGTLVPPFGLVPVFLLISGVFFSYTESCDGGPGMEEVCTGGPSPTMQAVQWVLVAFFAIAPFLTTIYLANRMRRRTA